MVDATTDMASDFLFERLILVSLDDVGESAELDKKLDGAEDGTRLGSTGIDVGEGMRASSANNWWLRVAELMVGGSVACGPRQIYLPRLTSGMRLSIASKWRKPFALNGFACL